MYIPADISRHASATQKLLQKYGVRLRKYRNCCKNDGGRLQQYAIAAGMKEADVDNTGRRRHALATKRT